MRPEAINTIAMQVLNAAENPIPFFKGGAPFSVLLRVGCCSAHSTRALLNRIAPPEMIWDSIVFVLFAVFQLLLREGRNAIRPRKDNMSR